MKMHENSVPTDTITFDGPIVLPTSDVAPPLPQDSTELPPCVAKVLHVINGEHYSGAERVQDLLALELPKLGFAADFACAKPDRFPAERQARDCLLHDVAMTSRWSLKAARQLEAIVREYDYDILHAHTPRTLMLASRVARRTKRPLVYHVHSPTQKDSTRLLQNKLNGWVENRSLRSASHVITVSTSLARWMEQSGFDPQRITVVHNGVPCTRMRRNATEPSGRYTLGTVALFRPRKGTEYLLEAIAALRVQGHDIHLRAVGPFESETYEKSLKDKVAELGLTGFVEWVGFTNNVQREFQQMDIFVLPSLFGEGLPMVVLEAMAAGVPVVGTQVEGVPEAVLDRITGVLARPKDAIDLANAIREIIKGTLKWSALREAATVRHAEFFSDRSMARGVADVYQELLPTRGTGGKRVISQCKSG